MLQPYAVSKAAQIHLVKSLAIIAAPKVRVNSVSPGVLLTASISLHVCFFRRLTVNRSGVASSLKKGSEQCKRLASWNDSQRLRCVHRTRETTPIGKDADRNLVQDVAEQVKIFALSKSVTGQNAVVDAGFSLSI